MDASMPSPIGHVLAGVAVALAGDRQAVDPGLWRFLTRPLTLALVALATVPDADLLLRGFHRRATHSLGATILVTIVAIVVTGWVIRSRQSPVGSRQSAVNSRQSTVGSPQAAGGRVVWQVVLLCALAHASHLVTDWLGADTYDPSGIQALWPFSDGWYISGWDLFARVERRNPLSWPTMVANLLAVVREIAILGSLVTVLWWMRSRRGRTAGGERLRPCRAEDEQIRGEASAKKRAGGGAPAPLKKSWLSSGRRGQEGQEGQKE
jgi:membrane-bound metal-dependent hydrolase YbcI (DUF457 family)